MPTWAIGANRRPPRIFPCSLPTFARAEAAYVTPSTRSLLERGEPADYAFASSQALLDYATHRLLWSWYTRDRESGSPPEAPEMRFDPQAETRFDGEEDTDEDIEIPDP